MQATSKQHAITLIRELDPAADPAQWRRDLRSANRQIWLGSHGYAAGTIGTLHHMACCVMEMHDRHYVVFEANVDGDVDTFLRELCEKCPAFVTRAFGQCSHCPNSPPANWVYFLKGRLRPYGIYHIGNTGRRVTRILEEDRLSRPSRTTSRITCGRRIPAATPGAASLPVSVRAKGRLPTASIPDRCSFD